MARPAKSIAVATGAKTKQEISARMAVEDKLQSGFPELPEWLNDNQAELFHAVVNHYAEADILSALDAESLAAFCVAVDRLRAIESMVNNDPQLLWDNKLMGTRKIYESTMWRGCNEFCLSPQARAKIGSLVASKAKEGGDPLAEALK